MERKTQISAVDGKQELEITRNFNIPVELLYRAYVEPEIVEQWMGTKVVKMENRPHGGYELETRDPQGHVVFRANGVIHEIKPNSKITRTFEINDAPFGVQLEFLEFIRETEETCRLNIHVVFRSVDSRDQLMKLPFSSGLNMAHNRAGRSCKQI